MTPAFGKAPEPTWHGFLPGEPISAFIVLLPELRMMAAHRSADCRAFRGGREPVIRLGPGHRNGKARRARSMGALGVYRLIEPGSAPKWSDPPRRAGAPRCPSEQP